MSLYNADKGLVAVDEDGVSELALLMSAALCAMLMKS
jgi:hypothetical protein